MRFMSTGIAFRSLSFLFRISHCDISKIIYETCIAIWEQFVLKHMPYLTEELLEQTAKEYENIRRYPNCVATISSIQFCNKCPKNSDLDDSSSNKLYYINLQGLVDSKYKFLSVEAVTNEHQNEGSFFLESALYKHLEEGTFPFPGPRPLPGTATKHPYVVVGDQRYPLKEYLMRPYTSGSEKISPTIEAFNIRHNQAKEAADRAFGILVAKWKCLKTGLQMDQQHVDTLVTTACLLHNIIIDKEGVMDANMLPNSVSVTKSSRSSVTRSQCRLKNYNRASQEAHKIRDIFKTYFKYHY
ncbi:putative nuclease HARBI1 isoform X2 [Physella acuta]|uniref:putative nuclease HARBI1 isoform X2 n=1 Tax=Physella acuta TaxID=109671 RepID=UPI0027DB524B|nr:putative nuclease HARBI1 isoform X2 [Physella acuta]